LPVDVGLRRLLITREQVMQAREWIRSKLRPAPASSVEPQAVVSLAKLKGARSRVVLGDANRDATEAPALRSAPAPHDAAPTTVVSKETATSAEPLPSRLLDAKRKRRE